MESGHRNSLGRGSMASLAVELKPVQSSRIAAIGYDAEGFAMYVKFPPTKAAPTGKVFRYENVSEEIFDDIVNAKSIGTEFNRVIVQNADKFSYTCVDAGTGVAPSVTAIDTPAPFDPLPADVITMPMHQIAPPPAQDIPADPDGLKNRAIATRTEATAIVITTADECQAAQREAMRIREERKVVVARLNAIKEPATQAWKAACALFNEVDGRYAEAEKFLDDGIMAYRADVRRRENERIAAENRRRAEQEEAARKAQHEEFERQKRAAEEDAARRAAVLAQQDAAEALARGASPDEVQEILENPLPVTVRHVAPPPLAFAPAPPPSIEPLAIPKVQGYSTTTEWYFEITDESLIPMSYDFFSLDQKKINARVQALKQHANIPGVLVRSREVPRKNTSRK
ncbi:KTSC domain-containing protein [Acidobacteria bacterium AB60]|nr:KTSC domain-containing protein [Acidobacteria bacterium AB60]